MWGWKPEEHQPFPKAEPFESDEDGELPLTTH